MTTDAPSGDGLRKLVVCGLVSLTAEVIAGLLIGVAVGAFTPSDARDLGLFLLTPLVVLLGISVGGAMNRR